MADGQESDVSAPVPVLALEYAPPPPAAGRAWRWIGRVGLGVAWPVCVIAVTAVFFRTESVMMTGPALFVVGVLVLLAGLFTRDRAVCAIGGLHCSICLLFLVLVNALRWSPADARRPFLVMGSVYTLAVFVPTLYVLMREARGGRGAPQR